MPAAAIQATMGAKEVLVTRGTFAPRLWHPRAGRVLRPSTLEGRRAVTIGGGGLALIALAALLGGVVTGSAVGPVALVGVAAIVVAGGFGILALRRGERSLVVFATLLVWLFWVVFLIGELADPH